MCDTQSPIGFCDTALGVISACGYSTLTNCHPHLKPLDMLMNVSMNVVTYFCMGENFLLKDKEFVHIADMVKEGMSYHFNPWHHQINT